MEQAKRIIEKQHRDNVVLVKALKSARVELADLKRPSPLKIDADT